MQVHPVVLRLCAPIEGTDAARLADCLGLDPAKYHAATAAGASVRDAQEDALLASASALDDDARYKVRLSSLLTKMHAARWSRTWSLLRDCLCLATCRHLQRLLSSTMRACFGRLCIFP